MAEAVTLTPEERNVMCLRAVWELDKIARLLPEQVGFDDSGAHYAIRALAGRMLRLTSALMDALGETKPNDGRISHIVTLEGLGQG